MEPDRPDTELRPERSASSLGFLLSGIGLVLVVLGTTSSDAGEKAALLGLALVIFGGFVAVVLELRAVRGAGPRR